jgi:hypothetical protein
MDRKKQLATAGAISVTATAAIVALASSVGLFGLTENGPAVGKLSPIDSSRTTTSTTPGDSTSAATLPSTGPATQTPPPTAPSTGHDANDDDRATTSATTNTVPELSDDHGGDDNRGPGSSSSGRDHDDD